MARAITIYREKRKSNSWARWLVGRTMRYNKNNLISVVGKTGSGKTWSAISICEMMNKLDGVPFAIDHIVFSLRELMELINSGNLKKGSKIIFDEPQVSISSKDFQSEANKVFNFLLTTFRHRNLTLFFCTPFESLLDKSTRKLFHARFETWSIDKNKQKCRLIPRFIEYNDWKVEPYRKQMIVVWKDEDGRTKSRKMFYWDIPKPSKELIDQYEEKRLAFTTKLNHNITTRLEEFDKSGKSVTADIVELVRKDLTEKQERVMRVLANSDYKGSQETLGISLGAIHQHKKLAEKKGYNLEEFKEVEENK